MLGTECFSGPCLKDPGELCEPLLVGYDVGDGDCMKQPVPGKIYCKVRYRDVLPAAHGAAGEPRQHVVSDQLVVVVLRELEVVCGLDVDQCAIDNDVGVGTSYQYGGTAEFGVQQAVTGCRKVRHAFYSERQQAAQVCQVTPVGMLVKRLVQDAGPVVGIELCQHDACGEQVVGRLSVLQVFGMQCFGGAYGCP